MQVELLALRAVELSGVLEAEEVCCWHPIWPPTHIDQEFACTASITVWHREINVA
jgi:hypothetical protein